MEFINNNGGLFVFLLVAGVILFACAISIVCDIIIFNSVKSDTHEQETDM